MNAAALARVGYRRVSGSEVVELHRCPWRWHLHHVRRLTRREGESKPGTVWGTAYHAAIAVLLVARVTEVGHLDRPLLLDFGSPFDAAEQAALDALTERGIEPDDVLAWRKTTRVARDVCEEAARAAEEVDAWLHAAGWRVAVLPLGPGGAMVPAVEVLLGATFTTDGVTFGGDGRADTLMHDPTGALCLVDHKTMDRWPERVPGLSADEVTGVDLRDDFQARNYVEILAANGIKVDRVLHLVRRASVPKPPPIVYKPDDKRHGPSRAKDLDTSPDLYRAAVIGCGKNPEDYAAEIERAGLVRWQAWATVEIAPAAQRRTLPIVRDAVQRMNAYASLASEDVPRHPVAGRHPGSCMRCPDRQLCVLEQRNAPRLDVDLEVEGRYVTATDRYPVDVSVDTGDLDD